MTTLIGNKTLHGPVGFRTLAAWTPERYYSPCFPQVQWQRDWMRAECRTCYEADRFIPHEECECGIHAHWDFQTNLMWGATILSGFNNRGYVMTLTEASGATILFQKGYRTEQAQIVAIVAAQLRPTFMSRFWNDDENLATITSNTVLQAAASFFDVPLVDIVEAEILAAQHNAPFREGINVSVGQ